jgi:hypothetical protein
MPLYANRSRVRTRFYNIGQQATGLFGLVFYSAFHRRALGAENVRMEVSTKPSDCGLDAVSGGSKEFIEFMGY